MGFNSVNPTYVITFAASSSMKGESTASVADNSSGNSSSSSVAYLGGESTGSVASGGSSCGSSGGSFSAIA